MYIACQEGHLEIVQWLHTNGATMDVTRPYNDGATPMYIACRKGHFEIVQFLHENIITGLHSEITTLRTENNDFRALLSVPVFDVDNGKVKMTMPPKSTLHDIKTKKRKRDAKPEESYEHQAKEQSKRVTVKVEESEKRLNSSKKETEEAREKLEEAKEGWVGVHCLLGSETCCPLSTVQSFEHV